MTGLRSDCGLHKASVNQAMRLYLLYLPAFEQLEQLKKGYTHEVWLSPEEPSTERSDDASRRKTTAWYSPPR